MAIERVQTLEEFEQLWSQVIARTWTDSRFRQRLLAEPSTVLTEQGIQIPSGVEVRIHEGPSTTVNLSLPTGPGDELTDAELDFISGGGATTCSAVCCSNGVSFCMCDRSKCRV